MKKSETIKKLTSLLNSYENCKLDEQMAREIIQFLQDQGMTPVSKQMGLFGTAFVYDWEENITDNRWSKAFYDQNRE